IDEVRDFAQLHWLLARTEAHDGLKRLLSSLFLLAFGVTMGTLVLMAAGFALFLALERVMSPAWAAALVALVYAAIGAVACWAGWRLIRSAGVLSLPQTRAMLWELISCRDKPTSSSPRSAPGADR